MRSISLILPLLKVCSKHRATPFTFLCLLALALLLGGCASDRQTGRKLRFSRVVVDAGHGGSDRGTFSSRLILEKTAALDIALKLNERLQAAGLQTTLTRRGDYFIALDERVRISNSTRDAIFVSVHLNESRPRPGIHGTEVYYYNSGSVGLARRALAEVGSVPGLFPRALKTARFRVLRNNRNPAILVECGYLSNRGEAARFNSAGYRQKVADAIARAILAQRE